MLHLLSHPWKLGVERSALFSFCSWFGWLLVNLRLHHHENLRIQGGWGVSYQRKTKHLIWLKIHRTGRYYFLVQASEIPLWTRKTYVMVRYTGKKEQKHKKTHFLSNWMLRRADGLWCFRNVFNLICIMELNSKKQLISF